jgi:hypothetical protein
VPLERTSPASSGKKKQVKKSGDGVRIFLLTCRSALHIGSVASRRWQWIPVLHPRALRPLDPDCLRPCDLVGGGYVAAEIGRLFTFLAVVGTWADQPPSGVVRAGPRVARRPVLAVRPRLRSPVVFWLEGGWLGVESRGTEEKKATKVTYRPTDRPTYLFFLRFSEIFWWCF